MADSPLAVSIRNNALSLGLFALLAAILLGAANFLTADRIEEQRLAAERRALADILPAPFHDNDLLAARFTLDPRSPAIQAFSLPDLLQLTSMHQGYIARRQGNFAGAILPVQAHDGYSGDITLLVGILADGSISGVRVLDHKETPGLGDKIDIAVSDWILAFNGKSLDNPPQARWQVTRDGGDFDQLVGATVTPRAVVNAVQRALQFFSLNRQQLATQ